MADDLSVQQDGEVLRLTFNRPAEGNTVTDDMARELTRQLDGAATKSRLVVLRSAGADFCLGRAGMRAGAVARPDAYERRRGNEFVFDCFDSFRRTKVPVICAVRGRANGFGCAVTGLSDVTIATPEATFQIPEMTHGIMPTIVLSALLARVPAKALAYLTYSAEPVDAQTALGYGIVSRIVDDAALDAAIDKLVAAILKTARPASEGAKEYLRVASGLPVASVVELARQTHAVIHSSTEMKR